MTYDLAGDIRLDPRIKALLAAVPPASQPDVDSRETLVAQANSPEARTSAEGFRQVMELCDSEELAPSKGLHIPTATPSTSRSSGRRPPTWWPASTTSTAAG